MVVERTRSRSVVERGRGAKGNENVDMSSDSCGKERIRRPERRKDLGNDVRGSGGQRLG
jgi:hypothetical protein